MYDILIVISGIGFNMVCAFFFAFSIYFTTTSLLRGCPLIDDPCLGNNYSTFPSQEYRCPECGGGDRCDKFGNLANTWYRFDYVITTNYVIPESCGTIYPIWMNGTFPAESDNIVDRICCLSTYDSACKIAYSLKVKNCSSYHVYCMSELPTNCPSRYCFESPSLPTTTTTVTTPTKTATTTSIVREEEASTTTTFKIPITIGNTTSTMRSEETTTTTAQLPTHTETDKEFLHNNTTALPIINDCDDKNVITVIVAVVVTMVICAVVFSVIVYAVIQHFRRTQTEAQTTEMQVTYDDAEIAMTCDNANINCVDGIRQEEDKMTNPYVDMGQTYETINQNTMTGTDREYDKLNAIQMTK